MTNKKKKKNALREISKAASKSRRGVNQRFAADPGYKDKIKGTQTFLEMEPLRQVRSSAKSITKANRKPATLDGPTESRSAMDGFLDLLDTPARFMRHGIEAAASPEVDWHPLDVLKLDSKLGDEAKSIETIRKRSEEGDPVAKGYDFVTDVGGKALTVPAGLAAGAASAAEAIQSDKVSAGDAAQNWLKYMHEEAPKVNQQVAHGLASDPLTWTGGRTGKMAARGMKAGAKATKLAGNADVGKSVSKTYEQFGNTLQLKPELEKIARAAKLDPAAFDPNVLGVSKLGQLSNKATAKVDDFMRDLMPGFESLSEFDPATRNALKMQAKKAKAKGMSSAKAVAKAKLDLGVQPQIGKIADEAATVRDITPAQKQQLEALFANHPKATKGKLGRFVEGLEGMFKGAKTAAGPGYHGKNIVEDIGSQILAGNMDLDNYKQGIKYATGKLQDGDILATTPAGTKYTKLDIDRILDDVAVRDNVGGRLDMPDRAGMSKGFQIAQDVASLGLNRVGQRVAQGTDEAGKVSLLLDRLKKGDSPDMAMEYVFKYLPDYSTDTPVTKALGTIAPFSKWIGNMAVNTPGNIARNPRFANMPQHLSKAMQTDEANMQDTPPEYRKDAGLNFQAGPETRRGLGAAFKALGAREDLPLGAEPKGFGANVSLPMSHISAMAPAAKLAHGDLSGIAETAGPAYDLASELKNQRNRYGQEIDVTDKNYYIGKALETFLSNPALLGIEHLIGMNPRDPGRPEQFADEDKRANRTFNAAQGAFPISLTDPTSGLKDFLSSPAIKDLKKRGKKARASDKKSKREKMQKKGK